MITTCFDHIDFLPEDNTAVLVCDSYKIASRLINGEWCLCFNFLDADGEDAGLTIAFRPATLVSIRGDIATGVMQ